MTTQPTKRKVSVILPTYDERKNIKELVPLLFSYIPDANVYVVDDNSPDGTAEAVVVMQNRFPRLFLLRRMGKEGLGKAYVYAFKEVLKDKDVDIVVMMDADLSHHPKYLPEMLAQMTEGNVVIGSRYAKGGKTTGWELWRRILSVCGNWYCRVITGMPIRDCTGGFNVISATALRRIDLDALDMSGFAFIMDLKYSLYSIGASFSEIPILFANRRMGKSKISNHVIQEGIVAPWKMRFKPKTGTEKIVFSCIACGERSQSFFTRKNGHNIYRCDTCRMCSIFPVPSPSTIDAVYTGDYFSGAKNGFGYVDYDTDKKAMASVFENHLVKFEKICGNTGRLLDIGAATGFFLHIAKKRGWKTDGVEISKFAAGLGNSRGLSIKAGTIHETDFPAETFNVITMWDVIEHVPDPNQDLNKASSLLKSGGLLAINTQDIGSLFARIMGTRWHQLVTPEHIYHFNRNSLSMLLKKNNFEILEIGCIGKRFTIEYIVHMLYNWQKLRIWAFALAYLEKHPKIARLAIPLNLRDNMFLLAKKI